MAGVMLAWGKKLTGEERRLVRVMCARLGVEPDFMMAAMAFETGETFSPSVRNPVSSATGLIQFMASTAKALGTSVEALAGMTFAEQLVWVEKYFTPWKGRLVSLEDVYMAILWPAAVGKPLDYVLFAKADSKRRRAYLANAGLDVNYDGKITKAEAAGKVRAKLVKGRRLEWAG